MFRPRNSISFFVKGGLYWKGVSLLVFAFFVVGIPIFAKQWTFDTENVTHLLSTWNAIVEDYQVQKYAQNTQVPTNLFVLNMEKYDTQRWSIMLEGIQGTKLFLQQQYPRCLLSDTQISALLFFTHKEFARELRQQLPEKAHPTALAYQEACKTLTTCVEGEKSKNLNKVCETLVRQAYSMHASLQQNKLLIEESNLRQDIYQNGNTDDASYDLMDDIAVIGKLWFEDTQEPPELIFYRSPQFSTRADNPQRSQRTVSTGGRASLPASQIRSGGKRANPRSSVSSSLRTRQGEGASSQDGEVPATLLLSEDRAVNAFIKAHEAQATQAQKGDVAFVTPCIAPGNSLESVSDPSTPSGSSSSSSQSQGSSAISSESSSLKPQVTPLALSPEQLNAYIKEAFEATQLLKATIDPNFPVQERYGLQETFTTDAFVLNDVKAQLENCLTKCTPLPRDDRFTCQLQCLCTEYSSKKLPEKTKFHFLDEGSLGVQLCTVPSKISIPKTHEKKIISIEGLLKEIWQVIDGLYDSGELTIKRNNKEFLNTTQADYTFENSVSVLAGISRKPFRSTLNAQAQQKLQSDYNQERKASYQQDPDERNRYLLLDRYDATKYRRGPSRPEIAKPQEVSSPIDQSMVQTQKKSAQVNFLIMNFLEKQRSILVNLNTTLLEMEEILLALQEKK